LVRGSLGAFYYGKGRLEEAAKQYRLGLELDGDAWPSVVGLANVYAAQGKAAEAERLYRRALASRPTPAHHFVLADFLQDQKRLDEARIHYLQGLALAPYHAGARNQVGNVYAKQQNWPAAREQYERALKLNPKSAGMHFNLGNVLASQGHHAEAIQQFTRALELDPARVDTRNSLGYALASQGNLDEAIQRYQQALAIKPDFAEAHLNLAEALARRGELDQARIHFESALKFQTNSAKAHIGLAGIFAAIRQPAQAVLCLREAILLEPDSADPLNNLAWLLATHSEAAFRDGPEAVRLAARAVELTKTNDLEMLDTLAAANAEAGQFSQAVAVARQALEMAGRAGQTNQLTPISNRLELYRKGIPFRKQ
jgi:tetratricopeptide (TPR) repeat protein